MTNGERSIGFAIVGTGSIASVHAEAIARVPGAHLVAIHGRSPGKAKEFARRLGVPAVDDFQVLLARPEIEVICVATPSGSHGEIALAGFRAGKHVLCEKPLEISPERIDVMIAAAARANRILAPILPYRFGHGAQYLKCAIGKGRFGRLSLCSAYVKWWRDPTYYSTSSWKGTSVLDGGGALMNQAIHAVDLLQWLAGYPVRVQGKVSTRVHAIEMEDTAVAWLEFAHGGLGVIEAATSCYPGQSLRIEISGEDGTAILENDRLIKWTFRDESSQDMARLADDQGKVGGGASDPKAISSDGHRFLVADLVAAIRHCRPTAIAPFEGRQAVAIIRAIYMSSRTGIPVDLPSQAGMA